MELLEGLGKKVKHSPTLILHVILGLCRENGKENGNYYLGFRVPGKRQPSILRHT